MSMGKTMRSVRFPEADGGVREQKRPEVDSRWRADRDERLVRAARDAKRIERAERHTDRMNDDLGMPVGSTVRTVTA